MDIIRDHSWKGLPIKVERSSVQILNTNISENSCIRYFKNKIMFYIQFKENNQLYNKWISPIDYYSESQEKTVKGFLSLNPELYQKELIFN